MVFFVIARLTALISASTSVVGVASAGELHLLLRGVTRERFIKCCGLVVGQIAVSGSGCYLAIEVGFGKL
uniref:Uncharacterized protein n=1 Tax=Romanomermis culicivorax TaxID=13658 RepID=A0A915HN69_ROMCU